MDSVKGLALAAMMLLASATMLVFAMGDFSVDEELDSSQTMAEDPLIQGEDHDPVSYTHLTLPTILRV